MKRLKILQFCNEDKATAWQRTQAFKNMNVQLNVMFHSFHHKQYSFFLSILYSVFHRIGFPLERNNENKSIKKEVITNSYDVIFIEKCLSLKPSTLKYIRKTNPNIKMICYTLDDFLGKGNRSQYFINSIPLYDIIATNKLHNITPYKNYGAQKVYYFKNAFSKVVHRPLAISEEEKRVYCADVSFIGTYEKDRAETLIYLAENGIRITVWGWTRDSKKGRINHPNILNMERYAYLDEFSKVIAGSKICLNFLRKSNKDTETTRSIEIPACRGFMIAERTEQHLELFTEGKEAEYFSSNEELLSKIKYYLQHEAQRRKIAEDGYNRCIISDYSYEKQLSNILEQVI